jgi:NAD(P)-dependent dehydrogenase (short-subunit alcohol dehydrogenase family)
MDMRDRVCVVTGATRGIGRATALALAKMGAHVVLVGRDETRLDAVRTEARRDGNNLQVFWVRADLASLASVRHAAEEIAHRWSAIHVLVNNAGVNSARRETSADGHELTLAVNHLGPFLLTTMLIPSLARGAPSRVINVTSPFAHFGRLDFTDLMFDRRRYGSTRAYTGSKLATAMFTLDLADRVEGFGITVNCVSPGLVATDLLREHWWSRSALLRPVWKKVLLAPDVAAGRVVRVATAESLIETTGQCFGATLRPILFPSAARNPTARERLWKESARLTNSPDIRASGGIR